VVTHQTYPRGPQEQDVAWITKTVRDLSGVPTMPCTEPNFSEKTGWKFILPFSTTPIISTGKIPI
jgi:hypothetical protein